jgi:pseudaminic acid cytidylyltransferase
VTGALAIIPARGGSKRIPRKNVLPFRGRPILSYAVQAAIESGCFDEVMVSTDDEEIACVAREAGASVPFMRSPSTSDDHATTAEVLREVLRGYEALGRTFPAACCLYATAVLTSPERLRQAGKLLDDDVNAEGVITVVRTPQPAVRALVVRSSRVEFLFQELRNTRSQDSSETYFDAAQMYWLRPEPFLASEEKTMSFLKRLPLVIGEMETQDINTFEDWQLAEWKHEFLQQHPETLKL